MDLSPSVGYHSMKSMHQKVGKKNEMKQNL